MDSYVHFYFFFLIILFPFSSLAQTNGTIPVGTTLTATTENSTPWLSPSGDFAFGFQFLQQNGLFLLSIWYHNLPQKTIVWYANEGNLVPNGSKIELNAQCGLVLTDPQGIQLWISSPNSSTIDHGFINDTGNFVLLGRDSSSLWESFGDPTDTLLPTQTMEINGVLNARKSETNFSQGRFQFRLDENGNAVLNPRDLGSDVTYGSYYSGNTNDISNLSNSGRQLVLYETGQIFIVRRNGERVDLTGQTVTSSADYYYRATLNFDGVFAVYSHPKRPDGDQNWTSIWSKPDNICLDLTEDKGSGACGHNSVCELNKYRRPVCNCPKGHVLMDPNDEYGSCKPTFVQSCDENGTNLGNDLYSLHEMSHVDWPFNDYEHRNQSSAEGCKNSCLNDCFCAVAIYIRDSCWKKRMPLSNGRRDTSVNHRAFLKFRIPLKDGSRNKKQLHMVIPVSIALVLVVVSGFVLCFLCLRIRKLKRTETNGEDRDLLLLNLDNSSKANTHIINKSGEDKKEIDLPMFSFSSISAATNKFSVANKLGEGGFGPVYKGSLVNGKSVAVKRLSKMSGQGLEELRNEAILIAKLQHRNLVRLLGYCIKKDEKILIYEYMPNKSLDSFLFDPNKQKLLNWSRRVQIIEGIAQGILYLHEYSRLRIIHRDLKASNILLDGDMNPKISDFGMARIFGGNQLQANTNRIVGTYGYMSPEYAMEGRFSVKSDVFAFGVLLLEILSGKKNTGFHHLDYLSLLGYAWELWENERALELIDPILQIPSSSSMPLRYILVGLLCVQDSLEDRPTISDVLAMLSNEHTTLASPKRPAFTSGRTLLFASSDRGKAKNCSINDLTTSIFEAR